MGLSCVRDDNLDCNGNGFRNTLGSIDDAICNTSGVHYGVWGWGADPDRPDFATPIHLYFDGPSGQGQGVNIGLAGSPAENPIDCNAIKAAIAYAGGTGNFTCNHRYKYAIPDQYRDGKNHSVFAYAIDLTGNGNTALGYKTFNCPPPPSASLTIKVAGAGTTGSANFTDAGGHDIGACGGSFAVSLASGKTCTSGAGQGIGWHYHTQGNVTGYGGAIVDAPATIGTGNNVRNFVGWSGSNDNESGPDGQKHCRILSARQRCVNIAPGNSRTITANYAAAATPTPTRTPTPQPQVAQLTLSVSGNASGTKGTFKAVGPHPIGSCGTSFDIPPTKICTSNTGIGWHVHGNGRGGAVVEAPATIGTGSNLKNFTAWFGTNDDETGPNNQKHCGNLTARQLCVNIGPGQSKSAAAIYGTPPTATPTLTPTRTPTPTQPAATAPWIKAVNTSFKSRNNNIKNPIPVGALRYDLTDDPGNPYMLDNSSGSNAGLATAQGLDVDDSNPSARVSASNWLRSEPAASSYTRADYLAYIKSRRKYTTIDSLSDINADGIYISTDNLSTAPANSFPAGRRAVIITTGDVTITPNSLNKTNVSLAIVARTINIQNNADDIHAILVADSINTSPNDHVKIKGNLVTQDLEWPNAEDSRPSMLIAGDLQLYLDLLQYFSTTTSKWTQRQ